MDEVVTGNITETNIISRSQGVIMAGTTQQHSLLGGTLGLVLYYRELWLYTGNEQYIQKASELLYNVYDSLNNEEALLYGPLFSSGVAGLAAVTNLLVKDGVLHQDEVDLTETDEFLAYSAADLFQKQANDFLHGAFGIVHYFSLKNPDKKTEQYITSLASVIEKAVIQNGNDAWFLNKIEGINETKEDINFSLSHGLSGMLLILMNVLKKYPHLTNLANIVHRGVSFIQKNRILRSPMDDDLTLYPFSVSADGEATANNRLAWCYGDLGPALVFHEYATVFKNNRYYQLGLEVGNHASTRIGFGETLVTDSHFCHGASGLLQIFHKLAVETKEPAYIRAKKHWHKETLYLLEQELDLNKHRDKETALLEGLPGVVLSLLSCNADKPAEWAKLLLV